MAANNGSNTGRKNYYNVSYGKLSTKVKDVPEGFTEMVEADLKSKTQAVEQVDLRNKYINKAKGDYPYAVFYDNITGVIVAQEKHENDNGTSLNLTLVDDDGDTSIVQVKFYSKYAENLLNRLLNADTTKQMTFTPYAIPNTTEINGKKVSFYTQGVSLKINGNKVEPLYKHDDPKLPATVQVKVQGKDTTSRDARLDFLYTEFSGMFKPATGIQTTQEKPVNSVPTATPQQAFDNTKSFAPDNNKNDQLPF